MKTWLRIAQVRLFTKLSQNVLEVTWGTNIKEKIKNFRKYPKLIPLDFISIEEFTSFHALNETLSMNISDATIKYCDLTFAEWLRGYCTLQEFARITSATDQNTIGIIKISEKDLIKLLKLAGLNKQSASTFIKNVTFGKGCSDLFDAPLIKLSSQSFCLFKPAIEIINPSQILLSRFNSFNIDLGKRGKLFEKQVLEFFKSKNLKAISQKTKIGKEEYDFDVLVRWDPYVFLFECKSRSIPFNSYQQSYFKSKDIYENVTQVKRLTNALKDNPDILENAFGAGSNALHIVPCVFNALPLSIPKGIDGVYFSDWSSVHRIFQNGAINVRISYKNRNIVVPTHKLWVGETMSSDDLFNQITDAFQATLVQKSIKLNRSDILIGKSIIISRETIDHSPPTTMDNLALASSIK